MGLHLDFIINQGNGAIYFDNFSTSKASAGFWTFISFLIIAFVWEIINFVSLFFNKKTIANYFLKVSFIDVKQEKEASFLKLVAYKFTNYFLLIGISLIIYFIIPSVYRYLVILIYLVVLNAISLILSCSVAEIICGLQKENYSKKNSTVNIYDYTILGLTKTNKSELRGETVSSLWDEKYSDGSLRSSTDGSRKIFNAFKIYHKRMLLIFWTFVISIIGVGVSAPFVASATYKESIFESSTNYYSKYSEVNLHFVQNTGTSVEANTVLQNFTEQIKSIYASDKTFFKVNNHQYTPDNLKLTQNGTYDILAIGPTELVDQLNTIVGAWTSSSNFTMTDQWGHPITFGLDPISGEQIVNPNDLFVGGSTSDVTQLELKAPSIDKTTTDFTKYNAFWAPLNGDYTNTNTPFFRWFQSQISTDKSKQPVNFPVNFNPYDFSTWNISSNPGTQLDELKNLIIRLNLQTDKKNTDITKIKIQQEDQTHDSGWKIIDRWLASIYSLSNNGSYWGKTLNGSLFSNVFGAIQPGSSEKDKKEILNINIQDTTSFKAYTGFLYWFLNPSYNQQALRTLTDKTKIQISTSNVDTNYKVWNNDGATEDPGNNLRPPKAQDYNRSDIISQVGSNRIHGYIFYWYSSMNQINKMIDKLRNNYQKANNSNYQIKFNNLYITANDSWKDDSLLFYLFNSQSMKNSAHFLQSDLLTYANSQGTFYNEGDTDKNTDKWNWYKNGWDVLFNYTYGIITDGSAYADTHVDPSCKNDSQGCWTSTIRNPHGTHSLNPQFQMNLNDIKGVYNNVFNPSANFDYAYLVGVYEMSAASDVAGSVQTADSTTHKYNYLTPGSSASSMNFTNGCDATMHACTGNNYTDSYTNDQITMISPYLRATIGNYSLNIFSIYQFPPSFFSTTFVVVELVLFSILTLLSTIFFFWRYKKSGWIALWTQTMFLFGYLLSELILQGAWQPSAMIGLIAGQAIILTIMCLFFEKILARKKEFENLDIDIENYKKVYKDKNWQVLEILLVIFAIIYLSYTIFFSAYKATSLRWMAYFSLAILLVHVFLNFYYNTYILKTLMQRNNLPLTKKDYQNYLKTRPELIKAKKKRKSKKVKSQEKK